MGYEGRSQVFMMLLLLLAFGFFATSQLLPDRCYLDSKPLGIEVLPEPGK